MKGIITDNGKLRNWLTSWASETEASGEKICMDNRFFEQPILNSPYDYPSRYWELDASGQPTQEIIENRRRAEFITLPGVNNLGSYGRWAFAEFTEVYQIESDFAKKVEDEFNKMIERRLKREK